MELLLRFLSLLLFQLFLLVNDVRTAPRPQGTQGIKVKHFTFSKHIFICSICDIKNVWCIIVDSSSGADASVQSNEKGDPVSTFVEQLLFLFVKKTEFELDFSLKIHI